MKYVIRRKGDDFYLVDIKNEKVYWEKSLKMACNLNLNKEDLPAVIKVLEKNGISKQDILIYTVIKPS